MVQPTWTSLAGQRMVHGCLMLMMVEVAVEWWLVMVSHRRGREEGSAGERRRLPCHLEAHREILDRKEGRTNR
jgi:hypothetical protein